MFISFFHFQILPIFATETEDVHSIQYLENSLCAVTGLHSGKPSYHWLHNLTKPNSLGFD